MESRDSEPLLSQSRHHEENDQDASIEERVQGYRAKCRRILSSRRKHFVVMSLVAVDVVALLANIFIKLIACEMHQDEDEPWVRILLETLEGIGLVISSLFMIELMACFFSFGSRRVLTQCFA